MRYFSWIAVSLLAFPVLSWGQASAEPSDESGVRLQPEVFLIGGVSNLFRAGSNFSDGGSNVGGGFAVHHRSGWGGEFEFSRMFGLSPKPVPCGTAGREVNGEFEPLPCSGSGRNGPETYTVASANVLYHFSDSNVQPYLSGGMGAAWSTGFSSVTFIGDTEVVITEETLKDTGLALNFGGGLRIQLARRIVLRPEFRLYDSTLRSRMNLSMAVFSVKLGYRW